MKKNYIMIVELTYLIILNFFIGFNYKVIASKLNIYDTPDKFRKFHQENVPLLGGLILILNLTFIVLYNIFAKSNYLGKSIFLVYNYSLISFLLCPILIFLIGLYDDKYNIEPTKKLFFTAFIVLIAIFSDPNININTLKFISFESEISLGKLNIIFTLLCILIFMNAFNMLDGINILAGLYSILFLLIIFSLKVMDPLILLLFTPLILFLYLNLKNKIFLGDSGSLLLGYLISIIVIFSYNANKEFYSEEILILMLFPGLEIIRLSCTRLINGLHPFEPDRNHLHHLLLLKFNQINTILIIFLLIISPIFLFYFIKLEILICIALGIIMYMYSLIFLKKK